MEFGRPQVSAIVLSLRRLKYESRFGVIPVASKNIRYVESERKGQICTNVRI